MKDQLNGLLIGLLMVCNMHGLQILHKSGGNTIVVLLLYLKRLDPMRVTTKGQVTIPINIRESLGISPESEVDFMEDNGKFYLVKTTQPQKSRHFSKFRGIASANMTTDEIMHLTRDS